ncbi:hypothetical protein MUY27_15625 [Mucilaginibacter sp. RS28]|uniref:Uncharacterized protein n=1 Tax=Mucilaginibacter straminoryzae TaxID=2932774 RepID=A0A9X1X505_9SPHI|nr:hypothetical protein [Mucilaginibacter straminoryzae]MCJ8211149.1 hypothetical protein [Mucilaginibacter straminoryzae]
MEQEFDVILTGTDGPIEGIARKVTLSDGTPAYNFESIDETVHLVVAKHDGEWIRVGGTDPYLIGWADELVEKVSQQNLL